MSTTNETKGFYKLSWVQRIGFGSGDLAQNLIFHWADAHPEQPPLVTLNSWNEWTETSYLQPDDLYGYGYLDAVKRVFLEDA